MTTRLGLGISRGEVRAMLVRDGRAIWRGRRPVDGSRELADVVVELLATAPLGRLIKPRAIAALGPGTTQVKRLGGLPAATDRATASQIVRGNPGRFFLRNGVPLAVSDAFASNGAWWGAVMETPAVAAVEDACKRVRVRLDGCVPTIVALASVVTDGTVSCDDSGTAVSLTLRRGAWIALRRDAARQNGHEVIPALARLGPDALPFADAFAAASCTDRSPLVLHPAGRQARRRGAIRLALAGVAAMAMAAAVCAPGIVASRQLAHDAPRLATLQKRNAMSARTLTELSAATSGLEEIGRFINGRRSMALLLARIAEALPDSTAIVTMRIDSVAGSLTLLSTSAASVIPKLATVDLISDPRIFGAVTRDAAGAAQLQRIAVRFGFPGRQKRPAAVSP